MWPIRVRPGSTRFWPVSIIEVADGEFLTIIGPSGCGKSTLLRVIADLLDPAAGAIEVLGDTAGGRRDAVGTSVSSSRIRPCCPGAR